MQLRPMQYLCSPPKECAWQYAKNIQLKKFIKQANTEKKQFYEKNKSQKKKVNEAREIFQRWIRLVRDVNQPCISCGNSVTTAWDAGHYLKAEKFTGIIFNEDNVHKQCKQCNKYMDGNEIQYRIGLVKKIGEDRVKFLEDNANANRIRRYSDDELNEIKIKYKQKLVDAGIK